MKKFVLFVACLFGVLASFSQEDEFEKMPYIKGDLLIMVDHNENIQTVVEAHRNVNGIFTELSLVKAVSEPANIWLLHFNHHNISHVRMVEEMYSDAHVVIAQNNHLVEERATVPNDPQYGSQWFHDDGPTDNDIDSELAWDITTGGTTANGDEIVVCVIEGGGAAWAHADLVANHWTNAIEAAGSNGVDDDGNGYIDDIDGWNSGTNNDNIASGSHGTGVSGMIGAVGNNGSQVVGANWNVGIMQVDMAGSLSESNVIAAYTYPLVMRQLYTSSGGTAGAFVVATNASWGIDGGDPASAPLWCAFYDTLGYYGILNMGATTNNNWNVDAVGDLPTACGSDYMISVTASNDNDERTFSGYGQTTIDLAAPGESVLITYNTSGTQSVSGTSFASPLTAGVAALLYSLPCSNLADMAMNNPQQAADIVRLALLDGTDPVAGLANDCVTGGRLNAFNSCSIILDDCASYDPACNGNFTATVTPATGCGSTCDGQIDVVASGGSGSYTYDIGSGPQPGSTFTGLCAGSYVVIVNDGANCNATVLSTVTQPDILTGSETTTHVSCNGDTDGSITLSASGGTAPYQYSVDGGTTFVGSGNFNNLAPGVYNTMIEDANGCQYTGTVGINEPAPLTTSSFTVDEINGADGAINLSVSGGTPPYTYSWTGPNSFTSAVEDPSGLEAGTYNVTVTDANGCTVSSGNIEVGSQLGLYDSEIHVAIYPNPADDEVVITLSENNATTMTLIDNSGRIVQTQKLTAKTTTIDISSLAAGMYTIKLTADDGRISLTKIVIE
ncbi:MAG: S8 family serine peptidase [Crocinitomicaceae bacterium]|nr:S8 family serine peptidase [Crocinitomicaceae bacterium]